MKDYAKAARLKRNMHGSKLSADELTRVRAMDELDEDLKNHCNDIDEGLIGDDAVKHRWFILFLFFRSSIGLHMCKHSSCPTYEFWTFPPHSPIKHIMAQSIGLS
jgi:hypothetical protein